MKDVKEIVLKQHTNLMNSRGVNKQSSEDMTFGRDDAIDSLGIVASCIIQSVKSK